MSQRRPTADEAESAAQAHEAIRDARLGKRTRARVDMTMDSRTAKVQRLLVFADRFRVMSQLRSDPAALADLLRHIIGLCHDVLGVNMARDWNARAGIQMGPDQAQCVRDLERLLQGLSRGVPESLRGLAHAMDALLIQCLLLESPPGDAARSAD
jgi:hypothetical protein